ncbi:MAG: RsmB/NOP family class I SAM-dependent RNA methyltransferase [Kiritimatiellia bacterium]
MTNSRRTAALAVFAWLQTREFPATLLPEGPDRAFVQDLVYTVFRRLRALRRVLGVLVPKWPKGELEALLYVGAAQILYMEEVPDYAAVNETVEAAKLCPNRAVAKVVNGVLHNLIRRRDEFAQLLASAPLAERESFPDEIVRRWTAHFGEATAAELCAWHNRPAETFLARPDGSFVALGRGQRVTDVPGYAEGAFIVQDPGTRLAVDLLGVYPGDEVLDACAAPGGKTVQLAWRSANVTACEVNPKRRRRLVENLTRLRLAEVEVVDALSALGPGGAARAFAKVLVDAPCSNTGVIRRRPDARWNWSAEKLQALVRLQAEILEQAAPLVSPGGTLVYSTCSNEPEENLDQVRAFLARHPDFTLAEAHESVPCRTGHDGAFAAKLVRNPSV